MNRVLYLLLLLYIPSAFSVSGTYWYSNTGVQSAIADSNPQDVCLRLGKVRYGDDLIIVSMPDSNGIGCVIKNPWNSENIITIQQLPFNCPGDETLLFPSDGTSGHLGCGIETVDCSNHKPITSSTNVNTACYNECAYETLGGFRDYDNALAPMAYEYIPTGNVCTGSEESNQLEAVSEYTEINQDELNCRTEGSVQVCIDEVSNCKLVNGYPVCFDSSINEDEYNCGTFNGEVVCFEKNAFSNCQYINGEYLCTYSDGNKIDPDSVDHPANGGNANGNTNDDILDQEDIINNSPEAQSVRKIITDSGIRHQAEKQAELDNPSSSISGIECDKTVSCTGDAIQCAIARIQKKQLCLSEFNESEINSIISSNPNMSPIGTQEGESLDIHIDDFLVTDEYVISASQCPEPLNYTVLGVEYEISMTPLCDLASYISWFIIFTTWFSMSIILAKALGNG